MSGVIKAAQADGAWTIARAVPPLRPAAEQALADARHDIARLHVELEAVRDAAVHAEAMAYQAGKAAGLAAAEADERHRIDLLTEAISRARIDWDRRVTELDALAVQLARATLAKLFGESIDLGALVARAIAHRLGEVRDGSVVTIVVSAQDFPDQAACDRLAGGAIAVVADRTMAAGACRFDLTFGHIDLGIASVAREVDALFAALARGESDA